MKKLIEKYFEGETSLEEEAQLRAYFNSGKVEEPLRQYQPLFQYFEKEQANTLNGDFEQQLLNRLNGNGKVFHMKSWQRRILQVAAIGAILVAAYLCFKQNQPVPRHQAINWEKYETTDPDLALEQTKEALKLLSTKLNKGKNKTVEEVSKVEKVSKFLN